MSSQIYSVYHVVHYIKESLDHDMRLQSILIKGEISNFTNHRSGHWYFTLKDQKAKISCVMFSSHASRCKILLKEGMKVMITASVSMYEASGSVQLYVTKVQVDGLGDLFLQLEQLKERLHKEGLFDFEHKKALPTYPMKIAVISARTGAAIQDILTTIERRWPVCEVVLYPALVQGINASQDIIQKLQEVDILGYDVVLLARGGGAIEDLWCFNDEQLARVIYRMQSVIVTGVGHETDTTLVDYVSDARAPTPTAAAECITPDINDVKATIHVMHLHMIRLIRHRMDMEKARLQTLKEHRYMKDPFSYIREEQLKLAMHVQELGSVEHRIHNEQATIKLYYEKLLSRFQGRYQESQQCSQDKKQKLLYAMQKTMENKRYRLQNQAGLLDAYSPLKILSRGYHIAYRDDLIIKKARDVQEKDILKLRMQDGIIEASVKKKEIW